MSDAKKQDGDIEMKDEQKKEEVKKTEEPAD